MNGLLRQCNTIVNRLLYGGDGDGLLEMVVQIK